VRAADYVIIGGGITGAGLAYHLAADGADVVLLDRRGICSGATGATHTQIGMHNRMPGIQLDLAFYTIRILETLGAELDCDLEVNRTGNLMLLEHEAAFGWVEGRRETQRRAGIVSEFIPLAELRRREPWLGPRVIAAVLYPQSIRMNSMRICHAYLKAAAGRGARILATAPATAIRVEGGRVTGVETAEGFISARNVVNAAGAWAAEVGAMAGVSVPIRLNKGHVVVTERVPEVGVKMKGEVILHDEAGSPTGPGGGSSPASEAEVRYGVKFVFTQTDHGNCLIGRSGEEPSDTARRGVDRRAVAAILSRATSFMPWLAGVRCIRTFTGFRPYSPDGLPMLGPSSRVEGFIVAAGHGDKGVGWLCTSKILADHLTGRRPEIPIDPFLFSRMEARSIEQ
jgi:glycine/D-amino acid oxidase-like deaminating enzyme